MRFVVDTGATYSLISADLAKRVGIEAGPVRDRVRLASGRTVRLPTALGGIRIEGREAATIFWIGPCDEPLLGVETLEALGQNLFVSAAEFRQSFEDPVESNAFEPGTRPPTSV